MKGKKGFILGAGVIALLLLGTVPVHAVITPAYPDPSGNYEVTGENNIDFTLEATGGTSVVVSDDATLTNTDNETALNVQTSGYGVDIGDNATVSGINAVEISNGGADISGTTVTNYGTIIGVERTTEPFYPAGYGIGLSTGDGENNSIHNFGSILGHRGAINGITSGLTITNEAGGEISIPAASTYPVREHAIGIAGSRNTITNSGLISGGLVSAIGFLGDENTVTNEDVGVITTDGYAVVGFMGNRNVFHNFGTITGTNLGILAQGDDNIINNYTSGLISTSGDGGHGIIVVGGSTASNWGTIETVGLNAFGMYALNSAFIYNYGLETIETWGVGSHGMVASDDSYTYNDGSIITHGVGAYGMYALNVSSADNYYGGTIITSGDAAHGMVAESGSKASNWGDITTHGTAAYGMLAFNTSEIYNYGAETIETWGVGSHGMVADSGSYALNTGSIITHGDDAYGMNALNVSRADNYGTIVTYGDRASGMVAGDNSIVRNYGDITTNGEAARGMVAQNLSSADNYGTIVTSGDTSHGMLAEYNSTAVNEGSILTSGDVGMGMYAYADSAAFNYGTIVTSGDAAHGMASENSSTAVNEGSILTSGFFGIGMFAYLNSAADNYGTIVTSGDTSYGMVADNNSTAVNEGSILTLGVEAIGMYALNGSSADNYGEIVTSGDSSHGMVASNNSWAYNYGDITTNGAAAYGMLAFDTSEIYNISDDTIETWGAGSHGMVAATNSYAENTGSIITHGDGAFGMYAVNGSSADNSGTILTSGTGSHGMVISGDSDGYNEGSVTANGPDSDAVQVIGGSRFVNAGSLDSPEGSSAVAAMDGSTVTLLDGTVLVRTHTLSGDVTSSLDVYMSEDLAAQVQGFGDMTKRGTGTLLVEEGSYSGNVYNEEGTLEIEDGTQFVADNFTQEPAATLKVYANPATTSDPLAIPLWVEGDAWIEGYLTADMTAATLPGYYTFIRASDYNGLEPYTTFENLSPLYLAWGPQWVDGWSGDYHYQTMLGYSFSEAALGLVSAIDDWSMLRWVMANHLQDVADSINDMEVGEKKIHAQALGGWTERDAAGATSPGYDSTQKGLSIGIDQKKSEETTWGLYAGYTESKVRFSGLPVTASDWEKQDTWHLGGYISKRTGNWILSDTLTYRSTDHDSYRAQAGGDATATFDSWAITNDIRAGYVAKEIGEDSNWQIIPEVGLNVGYFKRDGYSETNGFTYGDFDTTVVESVLGVRLRGEYEREDGSTFSPQFRLAWVHVLSGEGVTIEQSWGGTSHWFTENLDDDYFVADIGMSLYNTNNMEVSLNYNGRFSDNSTSHGGWIRFQWEF